MILVITILLLGLLLRLHNYALYPQRGATSDEYAFAFLGVSLLTKGEPISWSAIPLYINRTNLTIDKLYYSIVRPYLDHPPLYGLLVGAWALIMGQSTFEEVTLSIIRLVPITLSLVSLCFVFILGKSLYGYWVGLLSLLIYSVVTIYVVNARIVVAESLLTPIFLITLYIFIHKKVKSINTLLMLGVGSGLAVLTKILGLTSPLTLFVLSCVDKIKLRHIFIMMVPVVFSVALFMAYGMYFGSDFFFHVQAFQGSRALGAETLWILMTQPIIVNKIIYDGWYFWGFLSVILLSLQWKSHKYIVIPVAIYLFSLVASVTRTDIHGWYMLPLFPFMAIASGYTLKQAVTKRSMILLPFVLIVGASLIQYVYEVPFGLTPMRFRLLLAFIIAPIFLSLIFGKKKMFSWIAYSEIALLFVGTMIMTWMYVHPA